MKKLFIGLLLALTLVACGQQQTAESYKFGAVLPLTGTNAFYGDFAKAGIALAVEDLNAQGGINGRKVEIIYEDSAGDKSRATTAAQKLINIDGVSGIVTVTTPMGGAIAPVAEENKIPFIYASATNSFTTNKTYVFKDFPDAADLCQQLMRQALKDGNTHIALFGTNAEFTQLCKQGAEQIHPLEIFQTYDSGETDFRTQFTKIQSTESTALILSAFSTDCLNAYKQIKELQIKATLYIPYQSFACGSDVNTNANKDVLTHAHGADLALDPESTEPKFVALKKRLEAKGWTTQIRGSALMYDDITMLAHAYQGCNDDKTCAANNIRSITNYNGVSGTLTFGGKQTIHRDVMLTTFNGDKWVKV